MNDNSLVHVTDKSWDSEVLKSELLVFVDFWAEWCGPCRMVGPIVEELAKDYHGKVNVGKVNVDYNALVSQQYGVRNIPTTLFIKNGQVVDKQVGAVPKSVLDAKVKQHM